jgi:hypothetical protein
MPERAEAMPKAAPTPSSHQAAMPAYARVVGEKPPFAYESAKTVAATPVPTAAFRRIRVCLAFTLIDSKARYSIDRVRRAEPASQGRCRCRRGTLGVARRATAALACNNSTSAGSVYHECLPSGGGNSGKSTGRPSQGGKGGSGSVISGPAAKAVARAGRDSRALALVESTRPRGVLRSNPTSSSRPNRARWALRSISARAPGHS